MTVIKTQTQELEPLSVTGPTTTYYWHNYRKVADRHLLFFQVTKHVLHLKSIRTPRQVRGEDVGGGACEAMTVHS